MSKYATLIAQIAANIRRNGAQAITGDLLQEQLLAMITSLGEYYQFGGLASPSAEFTPGDEPVAFVAATPGTYTNFGGLVVADGEVALLVWSGSAWSKQTTDIATRSEVSQLGQEVTELSGTVESITTFVASTNKIPGELQVGYIYSDGTTSSSPDYYRYTDFIKVEVGKTYTCQSTNSSGRNVADIIFLAAYNSNKEVVPASGSGVTIREYTVPSGIAYVRITAVADNYIAFVEGTTVIDYEPYFEKTFISKDAIPDYSISNSTLEDKSVSVRKTDFGGIGKNLFNPLDEDFIVGKLLSGNAMLDYENYAITGYIPISEDNPNIICSISGTVISGAGDINYYDSKKNYVYSNGVNASSGIATYSKGVAYVRFTLPYYIGRQVMIEYGTTISRYSPYNQTLNANLSGVPTYYTEKEHTIPPNGSISLPVTYSNVNYIVSANINNYITSKIRIGRGKADYYGDWFEVSKDGDNYFIQLFINPIGVVTELKPIPFALSNRVQISIVSNYEKALVIVASDGNMFEWNVPYAGGGAGTGAPFVENDGDSIICSLSYSCNDYERGIWVFGDSYWSPSSASRCPYYLINWGMDKFLLSQLSGGSSSNLFSSLANDIEHGLPKYIVWCLGMNDGSDMDANTPSETWLTNYNKVISLCQSKGITPVFGTIPTVPGINNEAKNAHIRKSGFRYIDFAAAVGATSSGEWWPGMLSSDNVHPTELGAKALAMRVLVDFPEIALNR